MNTVETNSFVMSENDLMYVRIRFTQTANDIVVNQGMMNVSKNGAITIVFISLMFSNVNVRAGDGSGGSIIRTLDDDKIFVMFTHANRGCMVAVDKSGKISRNSKIWQCGYCTRIRKSAISGSTTTTLD